MTGISSGRLHDYYRANPTHLRGAECQHPVSPGVSLSNHAGEILSSAYLRGDLPLFHNRLKFVGGVRAEQTNIDAAGPLTDPTRNFQRNAQGQPILGANGRPLTILPTSDALGFQSSPTDRGGFVKKSICGYSRASMRASTSARIWSHARPSTRRSGGPISTSIPAA